MTSPAPAWYEAACAADHRGGRTSAHAWAVIAADLRDCAIERASVGMPGIATMYLDRAEDCAARSRRAHALETLQAILRPL